MSQTDQVLARARHCVFKNGGLKKERFIHLLNLSEILVAVLFATSLRSEIDFTRFHAQNELGFSKWFISGLVFSFVRFGHESKQDLASEQLTLVLLLRETVLLYASIKGVLILKKNNSD